MAAPLDRMRNIGIIAHIDAGKTTTTERILFYSGKEHRMGEVHEGTATMDWMAEERERGITITSAATTTAWNKHQINVIDTPGHVDFTAEVERSLRVLDGAIGVFCGVAGVEAQSHSVWMRANRYRVPRLAFVNKLDRTGADFEAVVADIRKSLGADAIVLTFPLGTEKDLRGVASVLTQKGYGFSDDDQGKTITEIELTEDETAQLEIYREKLIDKVTELSDDLLEKVLEGEQPTLEELTAALRAGTLSCTITPVFAGSALKNKGVQLLLDGVIDFLPSPLEVGTMAAEVAEGKKQGEVHQLGPDPKGPLVALAFKTFATSHGELSYLRVYSGTLKQNSQVYNPRAQKKERVGQLLVLHAMDRVKVESAGPGEIVATLGLKHTVTGDTLCGTHKPYSLEPMEFPETVISRAIEPRSTADRDKLLEALRKLAKEDPTFTAAADEETGQTIISGIGELHLDVLANRLKRDFKVDARVGKPRVSYRQTVTGQGTGRGRFEREAGQKRLFGAVVLEVEPWVPEAGARNRVKFVNALKTGELSRELIRAAEEGAVSAASAGGDFGYPIINIQIKLVSAEYHEQDSVDVAYNAAATFAFEDACKKAGLAMLEPLMRLEVSVPEDFYGTVLNDLQTRRASIEAIEVHG
ncbi:MAG: elongation factor G, partial [Planctomycetota bacterium]